MTPEVKTINQDSKLKKNVARTHEGLSNVSFRIGSV